MRALLVTLAMLAAALVLSACGGSNGLIPSSDANQLQADLNQVSDDVLLHDCAATVGDLGLVHSDYEALPASVDAALRANLAKGLAALDKAARKDCQSHASTGATGATAATGTTGATSATGSTSTTTSTTTTMTTTTTSSATTTTTTSSAATTATSSAATSTNESGASGPTQVPTTGAGGGAQAGGGATSSTGASAPSGIGGSGGVASGD